MLQPIFKCEKIRFKILSNNYVLYLLLGSCLHAERLIPQLLCKSLRSILVCPRNSSTKSKGGRMKIRKAVTLQFLG